MKSGSVFGVGSAKATVLYVNAVNTNVNGGRRFNQQRKLSTALIVTLLVIPLIGIIRSMDTLLILSTKGRQPLVTTM